MINGNLCGMLCEEHSENLVRADVHLYLPLHDDQLDVLHDTNEKSTFHVVSEKEATQREKLLRYSTTTDDEGNYSFELDEEHAQSYFDIDVVVKSLQNLPDVQPEPGPVQLHLTTIKPGYDDDGVFTYNYCIPNKFWCAIRAQYFDAWVICGYVRNCQTEQAVVNATVEAMDADFLTDDILGTAVTNADGFFTIEYTSQDFKKTFLSPWINVETDKGLPLSFKSGPDVYFKAYSGDINFIDETADNRRENVSNCLSVLLCTDRIIVDPNGNDAFPSAWTGIGRAFNTSDFDAEGYAGAEKFGLTGSIALTGQAPPKTAAGNAIEYRFLISETTTPNGSAAPADASFDQIVGVTPGLFRSSTVGKLRQKAFPFEVYNVVSAQEDFDAEGWFDINSAINRALTTNSLGALSNYVFIDSDDLLSLNTGALTNEANLPGNLVNAGEVFPEASKINIEKFAIRFEIREVVDKPALNFNTIPGSGKTLNSVVMNNDPSFIKLSIDQLELLGDCSPISGDINAKYTLHHPLLRSASLRVKNNSNSVNKNLTDGFLTLSANTNDTTNASNNNGLPINASPNDLVRCTYDLTLFVRRRLHNGINAVGNEEPKISFFYDI
ncbi:hypothetical protein GCM10009117_02550 [Gangjinia marincola]|uniref:Carboxypeptidase regulatory-like domain-containing protein n=2 Tax=Gangjinia marincola TaxID=578463 RepID=A0ABN1MDD9_9FLAO